MICGSRKNEQEGRPNQACQAEILITLTLVQTLTLTLVQTQTKP